MYHIREYLIGHPTGFLLIRLKESGQYYLLQMQMNSVKPIFFPIYIPFSSSTIEYCECTSLFFLPIYIFLIFSAAILDLSQIKTQ